MLEPGTYHFIGHGRRYIRDAKYGIVGQNMEHAEPFESRQAAVDAAKTMKAKYGAEVTKRVVVQTVTITEEEI